MIEFTKSDKINGIQLVNELRALGIEIDDAINGSIYIVDNKLFLDIKEEDKFKAEAVVSGHIAQPASEPNIEDKLASVGLSLNDLKSALGLA